MVGVPEVDSEQLGTAYIEAVNCVTYVAKLRRWADAKPEKWHDVDGVPLPGPDFYIDVLMASYRKASGIVPHLYALYPIPDRPIAIGGVKATRCHVAALELARKTLTAAAQAANSIFFEGLDADTGEFRTHIPGVNGWRTQAVGRPLAPGERRSVGLAETDFRQRLQAMPAIDESEASVCITLEFERADKELQAAQKALAPVSRPDAKPTAEPTATPTLAGEPPSGAALCNPDAPKTELKAEASPDQSDTKLDVVAEDEVEFLFAVDGDGYYIQGFGERGYVPRLKGFSIISKLIQHPGVSVGLTELMGADEIGQAAGTHLSEQPTLDKKARAQIAAALCELVEDRDRAKRDNNSVGEDVAQRQIDVLTGQLKSATGLAGRDRDLNNDADRLRPTIQGGLNRAYKKLRESKPSMKELAEHFALSISCENSAYSYRPPIQAEWRFAK